jgi:hypothetical protein
MTSVIPGGIMKHELVAADAGESALSLLAYPFAATFIAAALLIYAISWVSGIRPDWKP